MLCIMFSLLLFAFDCLSASFYLFLSLFFAVFPPCFGYARPVSIWEVIIKHQQGRLPLPGPPDTFLPEQRELHSIVSFPVTEEAVIRISQLPGLHKDPFDRLLIAQALTHELVLVTVDQHIADYPVPQL